MAAVAGLVLSAAACSGAQHDDEPHGSVPTQADPLAAAVRVIAFGCHATATVGAGSFIAGERVLTVAHVVAGAERVEVILADGSRETAKVTAIDRQQDLALLDVEVPIAPLALGTMPRGASGVFVAYRDDAPTALPFRVLSYGTIEVPDVDLGGTTHRRGFELDAEVQDGDSGSVLVSGGVATGVVFARSSRQSDRAWAVDIGEVHHLLEADTDAAVDTGACVVPG